MEENLSGREKKKGNSIFNKKEIWISGIVGILIGATVIYLLGIFGVKGFGNETIASIKGKNLTENIVYKEMKKNYPIDYVLESVDKLILKDKYNLNEEQEKEINDEIDSMIEYYGEDYILEYYGVETKEELVDYMKFNYKRSLFYIDYLKTKISQEEIEKFYNENEIYGKINTRHILVAKSEDVTEAQALTKANEIISKLNEGKSFDDVAKEYVDNVAIISENVDFNWANESLLAQEFVMASKGLEKDNYTKEAVLTSYGYHIIYCVNKAEKPSLEESENDIVQKLGEPMEKADPYIRYKALIKLREENGLKFKDEKYKEEYKKYCDEINGVTQE